MKRILGLDLGTNSIGWALVEISEGGTKRIVKLGSRIVPMDGAEMSNFKKGLPQTKNAQKLEKKGIRVGNKRYKQRRNKLVYVLQKLDMLPEQIKLSQPFDNPLKIQKVNILPIEVGTEQYTAKEFMQLRARAIHEKVSLKEFGKILYKFNQLRGYAGGYEEDMQEELDDVLGIISDNVFPAQENRLGLFKIIDYTPTEEFEKKKKVYKVCVLDDENEEWSGTTLVENLTIGDTIELKQTIRRNTKTGKLTSPPKFFIPKKTGWRKKMENLEEALSKFSEEKGKEAYLSEFFLERLNENQWRRIRDNVILRSRYKEEFDAIWEKQKSHFQNTPKKTIEEIANFLFPGSKKTQIALRKEAIEKGLHHIVRNQIIYYQRELKDQSHLISECRFENGEKAVANSHPLFQEYRIWEQINKLSINRRIQVGISRNGKPRYKYQERTISPELKEHLYEELQKKQKIGFKAVYAKLFKYEDFQKGSEFFNGLSAKSELVGNKTRIILKKRLGNYWDILKLDNIANQIELWELLYHGKGNEYEMESPRNKVIANYLKNKGVDSPAFDKVVVAISKIKFTRSYQSISLKAINKTLPLVRAGKYYGSTSFSDDVNKKIIKLLNEEPQTAFEKALEVYLYEKENQKLIQGGFGNAHALMLLYGQHTASEVGVDEVLKFYHEIKALKRHSLRNPLVEQMVNETLMVVKDIWKQYGRPCEIKIELARELKNSKKRREKMHEANEKSRKENENIQKRLRELKEELSTGNIEKYKLWKKQPNTSVQFLGKLEATKSEVEKMKLWDEQGYIDPYTGKPIPLSDLFNKGKYDVDHIIPQSRYFDDSLSNKVVCATVVNRDKGNRTAMEYFEVGSIKCELLPKEVFMENVVNKFYGKKRKLLLATKIPDDPIERQKKETQYITVKVKEELAKIVGTSNVKTSTGGLTHYLRNHWGITEVFKNLLKERFENYFEQKGKKYFNDFKDKEKEPIPFLKELAKTNLPAKEQIKLFKKIDELSGVITKEEFVALYVKCHIFHSRNNLIIKGYSKRFDHRHHAMDALIVACTDEKAVKRLNDLNQHLQDWLKENVNQFDLELSVEDENLLDNFLQMGEQLRSKVVNDIEKFRRIELPWNGFQGDAQKALEEITVSHKPKDRLLIQYKEEKDKNGEIKKTKEKTMRIRGALHEETLYGLSQCAATYRVPLVKFAGNQFDTLGNIEKITNEFLKNTLRYHYVDIHKKSKSEAFSAEGIMGLNKRLSERTIIKNGKETPAPHPPIDKVKIFRKKLKQGKPQKTSLQKLDRGKSYNKNLYVNTGSNYLFAVLEKNGERIYDIISLFDAVELLKGEFNQVSDKGIFNKQELFKQHFEEKNNAKLLFMLKQLDMVYFPDDDEEVILEEESPLFKLYWESHERLKNIYSVTKFSGKQIYFIPHNIAEVLEKKVEMDSQNMLEFYGGRKIVKYCIPIELDRLGNLVKVIT